MATANHIRSYLFHHISAFSMHCELAVVSEDGCLVNARFNSPDLIWRFSKDNVVSREGDFLLINNRRKYGMEFCLPGGVPNFKVVFVPFETVPV